MEQASVEPASAEATSANLSSANPASANLTTAEQAGANPASLRRQVGDWLLDTDRHLLLGRGETRSIGAQNMALLGYFADRPGALLSREQLLDEVWRGVIVNDNTLSKAVADLRAQLGDDPRQPRYIVTVPRRGYRLVAPVRELGAADAAILLGSATTVVPDGTPERASRHAAGEAPANLPSSITRRRRALPGMLLPGLVLLALVGAAIWLVPASPPEGSHAGIYQRLTPLTSEPGIEVQPQFSPDGQWLTYIHYPPNAPDASGQIRLLSLAGERRTLPRPADAPVGASPESPVFAPDGARLAYVLRDARSCRIRLLRFAGAEAGGASAYRAADPVADDRPLADCAPTNRAIGVSVRWSADGRQLYYSARQQNVVRLMEHDWQTGRRQAVPGIEWPVAYALHPQKRQIAWSTLAPLSSRLMLLDRDSGANRLLQERPELHLGVEWEPQGRGLLLASALAGGRLELLDLDGRLHPLLLGIDPFYSPVFAPDGQRLALAQLQFSYDLWQKPLTGAAPAQPLIVGTRWDYSPRFSHSGQRLAFISTRGGVPAVWVSARDGSDSRNPFRLPENVWPVFLRWSPDDRYLLIGSSDLAIHRFDFVSGQLQRLGDKKLQARNPTWSHDGRAIWASRKHGERWMLTRLDIRDTAPASAANTTDASGFVDVMPARDVAYAEESPDGAWLYLLEPDERNRPQLRRYPCPSGDCAQAVRTPRGEPSVASHDGASPVSAKQISVNAVSEKTASEKSVSEKQDAEKHTIENMPGEISSGENQAGTSQNSQNVAGETLPILLNQRQWHSLDVRNESLYFLREEQGMLTLHRWRADQGVTALMPILSMLEAGPMLIDFAVTPDERDVIYTRVADMQSALVLLEK